MAPILAAMTLGGPAVGGWVAAIGTTEMRELRGRIPWYGTLANHAGIVLPAIVGGVVRYAIVMPSLANGDVALGRRFRGSDGRGSDLLLAEHGSRWRSCLRSGLASPCAVVIVGDSKGTAFNNLALAPLGWLMSIVYSIQWWATLLFALPLYTTRMASQRFVEMREMFTQTIGALAEAVDKRDPFTAHHSHRVKEIAVDIGRVMRVTDSELEALEWGGLLHDVGKIGVPGQRPAEAGAAQQGGADDHERAPGPGRRRSSRRSRSWPRSCRSSATTTSGTTARATRTG